MKAHVVGFLEKSKPDRWTKPETVTVLCGDLLEGVKPILDFGSADQLTGATTIEMCSKCLMAAKIPAKKRMWFYLVLPAERADRFNALKDDE